MLNTDEGLDKEKYFHLKTCKNSIFLYIISRQLMISKQLFVRIKVDCVVLYLSSHF